MATHAGQAPQTFTASLRRLALDMPRLGQQEAFRRIATLRMQAAAEGLAPAAELADGLAAALRRDRRGTPVPAWIEAIGHAAHCGSADRAAVPLLIATVNVRLAH